MRIVEQCQEEGWNKTISLVRFLYRGDQDDLSSKDYEFSKQSIAEHIEQGYCDAQQGLVTSPWLEPVAKEVGIALHDMSELKMRKRS